jgi:tetratricopeptide (TPR) repeat protein
MMSLGEAYRTKGDASVAMHWLEQSVESLSRFGFRSMQSWSQAMLAEAHRMLDNLARAHELASQALDISQDIKYWFGVGVAQHTLGRIALSEGSLADAERFLHEAQQTFATIQCRYWVARNHLDQAALAHTQDNPQAAASHLQEAKATFIALRLSKYIKLTENFASEYRVPLAEE